MRPYEDYENLDEYETDGSEYSDELGEEREQEQAREQARKPTREELEYLELRKKLKERVRKKLRQESGISLANGRDKTHNLPRDNYGSFFGKSQPVIAQRVIQESRSLLENPHLAARVSKSNNGSSKTVASAPGGSRPHASNDYHRPRKVPEVKIEKSKAQVLKDTRDYSFLLSDDQDVPTQIKAPPRNMSVSRTEASRSDHIQHKSKNPLTSSSNRKNDGFEERRSIPKSNQSGGAHRPASSSKPNLSSSDPRRHSAQNGSGPGRPLQTSSRHPVTSSRPPVTSSRPPVTSSRPPVTSSRPTAQTSRPLPKSEQSKRPMDQRANIQVQRNSSGVSDVRKPLPSHSQASSSKRPADHRREYQESDKGRILSKQAAPSSRPQMKQPIGSNHTRARLQDNRPKKRPARPDEDESTENIRSMIRGMFKYDPNKYNDDGDTRGMEADFRTIQMEENRSTRIARMEDEEELKKIEEEERRERMRREAKKRKLK